MDITGEQKDIMEGKAGELLQWAMTCMVKYGNAMDAGKLIPVTNVHTYVGTPEMLARIFSPPHIELDAARITMVKELLGQLKVKVKTTTSPPPTLRKCSPEEATDPDFYDTSEAVAIARKLGIQTTLTCTPYLVGNVPVKGETCSWLESSAISYINSILGAHTNRDGVELTLFSALLGVTPQFGMHLEENRKGTHLVRVECAVESLTDWGALGYFAGEAVGLGIPVFTGIRGPNLEEAKQLCSAVATSGGVALFHIAGVTPEAPTMEAAFGGKKHIAEFTFDAKTKAEVYEHLNYEANGKVGAIFIGCPHLGMAEIEEIARLIEGKRVTEGMELWLGVDYATRKLAERQGAAQIIEAAGGKFIERCPITTSTDMSGLKRMATNSAKMAHYAVNDLQSKVFFGSMKECIDIAVKGGE